MNNFSLHDSTPRNKQVAVNQERCEKRGRGNDGKVISTLTAGTRKSGSSPSRIFHPAVSSLIGSVICGQRAATATTRTTPERGWSSRPRPVTRLQATRQPLKGDARRVQRLVSLAPKNNDRPDPVTKQGKLSLSPKNNCFKNE